MAEADSAVGPYQAAPDRIQMQDSVHAMRAQRAETLLAHVQLVRQLLEVHALGVGGRDGLIEDRLHSAVVDGEPPWPPDIELDADPRQQAASVREGCRPSVAGASVRCRAPGNAQRVGVDVLVTDARPIVAATGNDVVANSAASHVHDDRLRANRDGVGNRSGNQERAQGTGRLHVLSRYTDRTAAPSGAAPAGPLPLDHDGGVGVDVCLTGS